MIKVTFNGGEVYRVTAGYGEIDSVHHVPHSGIDLAIPMHTKILSPTDGVVERLTHYKDNIGNGVIIRTPDGNHLILGHLSDNSEVSVGQHIHKGDLVGYSGNSGNSTGAHLHIGLEDNHGHFLDPSPYLNGAKAVVHHPPTNIDALQVFHEAMHQFGHTIAHMSLHFIHIIIHSDFLSLIADLF